MAPVPRVLIHNWRLKLAALGLSVFLWALVQTEPRDQETFSSVPVLIEVADTAWTTSGAPTPAVVELRLGGPTRAIVRLDREGPVIRVPIASVGSLDSVVTLRRDWVVLGERAGVTIESISPSTIQVAFEPAVTRLVPVSMRVQGHVPNGLALASDVGLNPRRVRVRGPESRILGLDSIRLEPFELGRVRESGIFTVAIDTSGLAGASVVPSTATLGVRVEDFVERVLTEIPVQVDTEDGEAAVVSDPLTISVRLEGPRTLVTAVDGSVLRVSVAPEFLRGMMVGEERRVPVRIDGVPDLVTAAPGSETVTVRRTADQALVGNGRDVP